MSFAKGKYYQAVGKLLIIAVALLAIFSISFVFTLSDPARYGTIMIFLLGFLYYPLMIKMGNKIEKLFDKKIDTICEEGRRAKQGWKGEEEVFGWLEEMVGKEYILKNVRIPGQTFDFDAIVISEKGIIVLEVKNWTHCVHFIGKCGYWVIEKIRIPMFFWRNPMWKFKKHLEALQKYLEVNNARDVSIHKAIIFSNGKSSWEGRPEVFIIRDKKSLEDFIGSVGEHSSCSEETQRNIKNLFKK